MLSPALQSIVTSAKALWKNVLVEDSDAEAVPDLLAAEEQVQEFVQELGRELTQVFVDVRREQAKQRRGLCSCGKTPTIHRMSEWKRETPFGPVTVQDPFTYCRKCRDSGRPLLSFLGTEREKWSLIVQEAVVDLATDEAVGKAVEKLGRHYPGVEMERTTALRMLHKYGERARDFIDEKHQAAREQAEEPPAEGSAGAVELEVEWDASMVPVANLESIETPEGEEPELTPVRGLPKRRRNCHWQETKVGLAQKPGEVSRLYTARPTDQLDESFDDLHALALLKGWTKETMVRGIADGAPHIRPRMAEAFNGGRFTFILDRPHCKEHLSSAGEALEAETMLGEGVTAQQWAASALAKLEVGQVAEVIAELRQAWEASAADPAARNDTLRKEANYFQRNADAVEYATYREQGWSVASSEVESAHRHLVQARLKIAGAWWHPDNVAKVLALRVLKANEGWWDEFWARQRETWGRRGASSAEAHRPAA